MGGPLAEARGHDEAKPACAGCRSFSPALPGGAGRLRLSVARGFTPRLPGPPIRWGG